MSAHVLLNLLNKFGKSYKMRASEHFITFSQRTSTNVRFYLSYDIKITLKSHFCRKKLEFYHYVRNVVMDVITFPENLFINFIACRYFTPKRDVIIMII